MIPRPFVLIVFLFATCSIWAQCSAPSTPGVRVCTPTAGAVTEYEPAIAVNSTPGSGSIEKFSIYVDGQDVYDGQPGQTGINLYDYSIRNGVHNLVVNAWDSTGQLFQAKETFTIVGEGYPLFCAAPSSPGVNFCTPDADGYQPTSIPVSATATGKAAITALRVYLDGQAQITVNGQDYISTAVNTTAAGNHNVTVVAWDADGNAYTASRQITTYYGDYSCAPKGNQCYPGIEAQTPQDEDYVDSSFLVEASVKDNPNPITAMKVYIDNTVVASSDGPMMDQQLENMPSGTHIITIQAWDTEGNLYKTAHNVNINVPH